MKISLVRYGGTEWNYAEAPPYVARPGYEQVRPVMIDRLKRRYPDVRFIDPQVSIKGPLP